MSLCLISDDDIRESFDIRTRAISCSIKETQHHSDDLKAAKIFLFMNAASIQEEHDYSIYEYRKVNGEKVVHLESLKFKGAYRDQGIAKDILNKNARVFRQNNFSHIKLKAIRDGVLVWPRLGFKVINDQHKSILLNQARMYLATVKNIPRDELRYKSIDDIDNDLLKSTAEHPVSFTEWRYQNQRINEYIEMSREL